MENNYNLLPKKFHEQHDFCLGLVNEIEKLIVDEEYAELRIQSINIQGKPNIEKGEHILDYLLRIGEKEFHDKHLTNHIIYGLLIDILYFLKEALSASTKRRLTVSFSLIRKPFVYDLIVLLRIFFTTDFLEEFNSNDGFDSTKITKQDLLELLELSTSALLTTSITKDDIFDFVFNQELPDSLINISNKALHPSTTRNKQNLTGIQNLNFIFSTIDDIESQWEYFYNRLSVLSIYLVEVCDFIICHQLKLDKNFYPKRLTDRMKLYKKTQ
ncbi:hypothetical protein [Sphingobacterium prati]|uniref:hypothetical protein n=1 Tax=Sphingobacterium prati TaxID=2737006 RepID=UPI0015556D4B|nr:hypothetical protein [Sphingobacterium prati]NPE48158.1 hypothetical protein [Sphingobacterium prati]